MSGMASPWLFVFCAFLTLAACRQHRKLQGSDSAAHIQKLEADNSKLRTSVENALVHVKTLEAEIARLRGRKCSIEQVPHEAEWALRRSLRVATDTEQDWSLVQAVKHLFKAAKRMVESGPTGPPDRVADTLDQLTRKDYQSYLERLKFKGYGMTNNLDHEAAAAHVITVQEWKLFRYVKTVVDDYGFFKSIVGGDPVDRRGQAIPFYSYPALEFFDHMDLKSATVLEFGSGMSTIWWAKRAGHVVSMETNPAWLHKLQAKIKEEGLTNIDLLLAPKHTLPNNGCPNQFDHKRCWLNPPIEEGIQRTAGCTCDGKNVVMKVESTLCGTKWEGKKFDVVIVDQEANRYSLSRMAGKLITSRGMVILDNTEMYPKSAHLLRERYDLAQIDFFGLKANSGEDTTVTTSLFLSRGAHKLLKGRRHPMIYDNLPVGAGFSAAHEARKFQAEGRDLTTLNATQAWDEEPDPGLDGEGQCKKRL